ncbi:MAG TPA: PAS domain-containing protein, partial [Solirubrobacteraceae bacterium]|nr:PAS domain-containing protein [Solirubrobacteraceae bacterium]
MTPSHSRAAAALGVLTALAGVLMLAGVVDGAPAPLSTWLVLMGLVLTWLGIDAGRRERRATAAVAARDRAESAWRAADARSRELADHAGDVLATIAADGSVIEVSEGCRELLDLAPGSLVGTRGADLVHPGDSATTVAAMRRLVAGEDDAAVTVRLRRADGAWRWAEAQLVPVRDSGRLTEVHATIRDVHARA